MNDQTKLPFPNDIIKYIFTLLPPESLPKLTQVNKQFRSIFNDDYPFSFALFNVRQKARLKAQRKLEKAIAESDVEQVETLLTQGLNPNGKMSDQYNFSVNKFEFCSSNDTYLIYAVKKCIKKINNDNYEQCPAYFKIISLLIEHGADLNARDNRNRGLVFLGMGQAFSKNCISETAYKQKNHPDWKAFHASEALYKLLVKAAKKQHLDWVTVKVKPKKYTPSL